MINQANLLKLLKNLLTACARRFTGIGIRKHADDDFLRTKHAHGAWDHTFNKEF